MERHIYRYFRFFYLFGLILLFSTSCSADAGEPSEPETPTTPTDEYTYLNVEYRKWQNGTFQLWTTADSRETRIIDNMNWYAPSGDYTRTAWGGRNGLQPSSVTGKEGFSELPIVEDELTCSILIMELLFYTGFSMFVRGNLQLIKRLSVQSMEVRPDGVRKLVICWQIII